MKTITVVLTMAMLSGANVWAKKPVDLSEFAGTYNGKGTVRAELVAYPASAKAKFVVAKNGRSAKVVLSGLVTGDAQVPWGTTLRLKRNGKLTTSNVIALEQGGPIFAASGKFNAPKSSKIEGSASVIVGGDTGAQTVKFAVKPKGKRKKSLTLDLSVIVNGALFYDFDAELTGK